MSITNIRVTTAISILAVIAILSMVAIIYLPMFQLKDGVANQVVIDKQQENIDNRGEDGVKKLPKDGEEILVKPEMEGESKKDEEIIKKYGIIEEQDGVDENKVEKAELIEKVMSEIDKEIMEKYKIIEEVNMKKTKVDKSVESEMDKAIIEKYSL